LFILVVVVLSHRLHHVNDRLHSLVILFPTLIQRAGQYSRRNRIFHKWVHSAALQLLLSPRLLGKSSHQEEWVLKKGGGDGTGGDCIAAVRAGGVDF
jgi:hypothetical protein